MDTLTPTQAGQIATAARKLLRLGHLTHREHALADALLWSCRKPGSAAACVSYTTLCRLARVSRGVVAAGLRALEAAGILRRVKRRLRMAWHNGATASRQLTSIYVLMPPARTEFGTATGDKSTEILTVVEAPKEAREAQAALAAVRERRGSALFQTRMTRKSAPG